VNPIRINNPEIDLPVEGFSNGGCDFWLLQQVRQFRVDRHSLNESCLISCALTYICQALRLVGDFIGIVLRNFEHLLLVQHAFKQ
jgi:hypothetical protein